MSRMTAPAEADIPAARRSAPPLANPADRTVTCARHRRRGVLLSSRNPCRVFTQRGHSHPRLFCHVLPSRSHRDFNAVGIRLVGHNVDRQRGLSGRRKV